MKVRFAVWCGAAVLWCGWVAEVGTAAEPGGNLPAGYSLLYQSDFAQPDFWRSFRLTDARAWRVAGTGRDAALELFGKSNYEPQHRSPFNIALLADRKFGDFVLEAELRSTVKPYGHQDMCLFFGFEGPSRFYYVHLAVKADPHAHNIFIVQDAPRLAIAKETTVGITWVENHWHKVRLERTAADGTVRVFFDDFTKPIMIANDHRFQSGYLGFGSFDDRGQIRHVRVWGPSAQPVRAEFFQERAAE